jgi:hypothetical protein
MLWADELGSFVSEHVMSMSLGMQKNQFTKGKISLARHSWLIDIEDNVHDSISNFQIIFFPYAL